MTGDRQRGADDRWPVSGAWIVGVDGSECSRSALTWAVTHAPGHATELHLVTAWQTPIYGPHSMTGPIAVPYDVGAIEAAAHEDVDRLAEWARRQLGIPVESIVVHAGASTALLDASAHGSLLVVGNRGRGGFARLLLGSTSSQCAAHATAPTVVVPGAAHVDRCERLLVGFDGSANSLAALDWALTFAGRTMKVVIEWVWDASPLAVGADEFFFPDASEIAEDRFHHLLDEAVDEHGDHVTIERRFVHGRPRFALAAAAEEADLVVLGARGHGAVGAALLGSVTSWVLHHVEKPIAIIPDRGPSP